MSEYTTTAVKKLQHTLEQLERENKLLRNHTEMLESDIVDREMQFSQLSKAAFEAIAIYQNGYILLVNEAMCELFGYNEDDLTDMEVLQLIAPDYKKSTASNFEKYFSDHIETVAIRKDGSTFPAKIRGKFIPHQGSRARVIIVHDLTQEKKVQNKLANSERRYRRLFQKSNDAIYLTTLDGHLQEMNEATLALFGYTQEEMLNMNAAQLYARSKDRAQFLEAVQKTGSVTNYEVELIKKDGTIMYCLLSTTARTDIFGKAIGFQGIIRDISKRRKQEEALKEYKQFFNLSFDMLCVAGTDGYFKTISPGFNHTLGYSKTELLAQPFVNFVHPKDKTSTLKEIDKLSKGEPTIYFRNRFLCKDGSYKWIAWTASPDTSTGLLYSVGRDITEIKKNNRLQREKDLALRGAKLKELFLANMSHEIRTPMNAVIGMTNLLLDTELNADQYKYVSGIHGASEHLLVLINDILDFSKIEAGKLNIEQVEFNLFEILHNVVETFKIKIQQSRIKLLVTTDEDLPVKLLGDPTRLIQVLLNLVSNAVKFTEKGYVEIEVDVLEQDLLNATLAFKVTDTGIGIPNAKLETIFDSFSQVSSDTTRQFGGTGLGLTISKKLVEMQGGSMSVHSEVGQGTTFSFVLKFKKGHKNSAEGNEKTFKKPEIKPLGNLRILLVEDNELNQVVAADTIKKWGTDITIDIANNGKEATILAEINEYDLVLMDVQMPEMNGYEATKYIRNELGKSNLPIIAMTAYATAGEAEKTIISGMNDYISKPFDPIKLYQKIAKLTRPFQFQGTITNNEPEEVTPRSVNDSTKVVDEQAKKFAAALTDFSYLNSATDGDPNLKARMLEIMLREVPDEVEQMETFLKEENWERLSSIAHKFRSAVTYMGLHEVKVIVSTIQVDAKNGNNLESMPELVKKVKTICLLACDEMKMELNRLNK